jgi:hypothetical protein
MTTREEERLQKQIERAQKQIEKRLQSMPSSLPPQCLALDTNTTDLNHLSHLLLFIALCHRG